MGVRKTNRLISINLAKLPHLDIRFSSSYMGLLLFCAILNSGCAEKVKQDEKAEQSNSILHESHDTPQVTPGAAETEVTTLADLAVENHAKQMLPEEPFNTHSPRQRFESYPTGEFTALKARAPDFKTGQIENRDNFAFIPDNSIKQVTEYPVSTFSVDVDTGSYSIMRRWINQGRLPQANTLRIEELINYFDYDYPKPEKSAIPFTVTTEIANSPFNQGRQLLRIGLKGYEAQPQRLGASNLVFLLDVSGSMAGSNKLPLLKRAMGMLVSQLGEKDIISIVVYAGDSGVVLDGVSAENTFDINRALKQLKAGGATNGSSGIKLAYELAQKHFIQAGNNRVILATDGDFNLGITDQKQLEQLISLQRQQGVFLTTLGFGQGNYNDALMERLADKGNGNYAYIDTLNEARKVLVEELTSQLFTIAKDVKIQIEFNPELVSEYRLIGYANRMLNRQDFNNDNKDAGEVGAGHSVTALYEISFHGSDNQAFDKLRYSSETADSLENRIVKNSDELAFLKLRYKPLESNKSLLIDQVIQAPKSPVSTKSPVSMAQASADFRFAAAVAGFGQLLNRSDYLGDFHYRHVISLASSATTPDRFGYRHEFLQLVKTAALLDNTLHGNQLNQVKPLHHTAIKNDGIVKQQNELVDNKVYDK